MIEIVRQSTLPNRVDFDDLPDIGIVIRVEYQKRRVARRFQLIGIDPYRRKDGRSSHVLIWRAVGTGKLLTSGLKGHSFYENIPPRWRWADSLDADSLALIGIPGFSGELLS